ncbi:patatin-like phospholipase family protein [Aurantiacibacter gangjinensis]|uniref:Phospholipase n=1 Tax=Aurantiacibacter gangjinensis TaxID=502682 RepID=A0A0G9MN62_9SPHN|nr:patatin-like phospholipase family protein [Aurantiacibacter gangjinensis]APE28222.1 Patatin-like phospholipase family protein [Aurantiacibacter gangjinensis]KLE32120.1 phospholipase [Aurantiacibacter gangjinensis]
MSDDWAPPFHFEQLVFAGGGIRCFWHGGFLAVAGNALQMQPKRISCVSGGALSSAAWIARRDHKLRRVMGEAFAGNDSNVDADKSNFTPHQEMYRAVVEETLDAEAIDAIADGPDFQVVLGLPPQWVPPRIYVMLSGAAYFAEKKVHSHPHLRWPRAVGLQPLRVDARQAARDGTLVDLICAAATIPPVFDVPEWNGKRVLDGGMCDKAPPPEPDEGRTLFLMTSLYDDLPQNDRRFYIQPSEEVPADKIDFSERSKVDETWDQGERDARSWLERRGLAG